jgi:multidrug efflux pump subunit AcrB
MPKISFVKVEQMFSETLRQIRIDRLTDLSAIVMLTQNPDAKLNKVSSQQILKKIQVELEGMKKNDLTIYQSLELTADEEKRLFDFERKFSSEDWDRLKRLRDKIEELKKELLGHSAPDEKFDEQVKKERIKHKDKRFNVREGWLPVD